jgi:hypothetical protein
MRYDSQSEKVKSLKSARPPQLAAAAAGIGCQVHFSKPISHPIQLFFMLWLLTDSVNDVSFCLAI